VIGQRKAAKSTVHVGDRPRSNGYVGGHSTADEGRELRRFDHVREDRGRGRFGKKPHGGLTVSGEAAAKQSQKPFKQRKDKGARALPEGNPAAFRSWYVPEGVDTGPSGHRNPDGHAPRKPYGKKPGGGQPRPGGNRPFGDRGPGGGYGQGESRGPGGPRGQGPRGPGQNQGQRAPRPYGHPGNAPNFPSDHANPGQTNPYDRPRGPRPPGNRPAGNRPAGNRPAGPRGPKPGGNRGPRGGGQHNGNR